MAKKKKGGLIERLIMGKEKSEGYARASLPSNRWELFWDIFKGRFWKLVLINLLMILTLVPLLALLYFRYAMIVGNGAVYPFAQGFGAGYQAPLDFTGYAEGIVFSANVTCYILLPIAVMFACIGIAGGAYVIRNMVWTEGIFVANDFWRGVKQNYKQILVIGLIFSVVFYATECATALIDQYLVTGVGIRWLLIVAKVILIGTLIFFSVMTVHMVCMSVTYEIKTIYLIKNSFLFTVGFFPHNLFFGFISVLPFLLASLGGIITLIAVAVLLLFGLSTLVLMWTEFCQWTYDGFINDKIGAQKNRGIYEKVKEDSAKSLQQYRSQIAMTSAPLYSKPVKPITDDELQLASLSEGFSRGDIVKLNESRAAIYEDNKKYEEEHKNDPEFNNPEREKAKLTAEEERNKRIEAAKRELAKRRKK